MDGEVPIDPGEAGYVLVERFPEDVFRPETLASGEGKPLCIEHPDQDVTPDNYKELAVGMMVNLRRGEGAFEDDLTLMDLIVYDREAMKELDGGTVELSAGYDAAYSLLSKGPPPRAKQYNIVYNHVAMLPHGRGRCGPRCVVKDHAKYVRVHDSISCGLKHPQQDASGAQLQAELDYHSNPLTSSDFDYHPLDADHHGLIHDNCTCGGTCDKCREAVAQAIKTDDFRTLGGGLRSFKTYRYLGHKKRRPVHLHLHV